MKESFGLHTFNTLDETKARIVAGMQDTVSCAQGDILFFVSGGSVLGVLNGIDFGVRAEKVTVCLLDERFSNEPSVNNFLQLQQTDFYKKSIKKGVHFIESIPQKTESLEDFSKRFEREVTSWLDNHAERTIIAVFGMGADGHTAGVFPYPENKDYFDETFLKTKHAVIGFDVGDKNQYKKRITTTPVLWTEINHAFLYACGPEKKEKLHELLYGKTHAPHSLPVSLIYQTKKQSIYTDQKI